MLADLPFDAAPDVGSIRYRLHPLDVGFDLRAEGVAVEIGDEPNLRVSYPARNHRRVLSGPRASVLDALQRLGFIFVVREG